MGVTLPYTQQEAVAAEVIVDPSFELGQLDVIGTLTPGWKTDQESFDIFYAVERSLPTFSSAGVAFSATNGKQYLSLTSGVPITAVTQMINFPSAGELSLKVFATTYEESSVGHSDTVRILLDGVVLFSKDTAELGSLGSLDWTLLVFQIDGAGEQLLVFENTTIGDYVAQTFFGIDELTFTPTTTVPLPPGALLLLSAMLFSPAMFRRTMNTA